MNHVTLYKVIIPVCILNSFMVHGIDPFNSRKLPPALSNLFQPSASSAEQLNNDDDIDIVYMPSISEKFQKRVSLEEEIDYNFKAFGSHINLRLRPNTHLIADNFKTVIRRDGEIDEQLENPKNRSCHYLHQESDIAAAFSFCNPNFVQGLLFLPNETLEIQPLPQRFSQDILGNENEQAVPHFVKRAAPIPNHFHDDEILLPNNLFFQELNSRLKRASSRNRKKAMKRKQSRLANGITIELALFFDEAAYRLFSPFFDNNDDKLRDMLLAYVNGVQALYHHPSLGRPIDLVLVRMELFRNQPQDLPHFQGERSQLLDSFCRYNQNHNPKEDSDPEHWDMGLYISGLDFFAYENGKKSGVTMGLATVGGVCLEQYNCIIAELGTTNVFGKPYPSAGFTSVYILAHEIGHNIGMHHDGTGNTCSQEGFIMSPSRGTNGETVWSGCSAKIANSMTWAKCLEDRPNSVKKEMDHEIYGETPGQMWNAKRQCEFLLRDRDAQIYNSQALEDICENLQCRTPYRSGFYFAGPALEGTTCGQNKWCQGGFCTVKKTKVPQKVVKGGWSAWNAQKCKSGCIKNAKGFQTRSRTCTNPKPVNTNEGCDGASFDAVLCKDDQICKKKRVSVEEYASMRCKEFSRHVGNLDPNGSGLQAPHESSRLWMGCAIFCRIKSADSYYTPRLDLNDLGIDAYFPDGTWCHHDGNLNYYCLQHHCLPENFKFIKKTIDTDDVPIPQNALNRLDPALDHDLFKYLSLDSNGRPLLTELKPSDDKNFFDDGLSDQDYVEIPK